MAFSEKKLRLYRRRYDPQTSVLELAGPLLMMSLKIHCRLSARHRRLFAVVFFRQIRPWIEFFHESSLHHLEDSGFTVQKAETRPMRDFGRRPLDHPDGLS